MTSSSLHIVDGQRLLSASLSLTAGNIDSAVWGEESFSLSPFLLINNQVAMAEKARECYLCTPECKRQAAGNYEVTLVARGALPILGCNEHKRVPWEMQLTTTYHAMSGCLAVWLRPQVHWRKGDIPQETLTFGWQLRWSQAWTAQGERWARSPQGALISIPEQDGVAAVVTASSLTLLADHTAPAALLLIEVPRDKERYLFPESRTALRVQYPGLRSGKVHGNGLPVVTTREQVDAFIQVNSPEVSTLRRSVSSAQAVSGTCAHFPEPGRYYCCWEWLPADGALPVEVTSQGEEQRNAGTTLQIIFPFRYWPEAAEHPAQAEFAQLLLTSDIGTDYIVAYNFANPRDVYLADDRDDILAEQAGISHALWQQLDDPDLYTVSVQMVEQLLLHQQPDGGFTFGVSVNGFRGDYSDTNADVIQCLLRLARCERADAEQAEQWIHAAWRSAGFMLTFQDPTGFFWGRTDRPSSFRYGNQPWFNSYVSVACLELLRDRQIHGAPPRSALIPEPEALYKAAKSGLRWLMNTQAATGSFRFDTEGYYADYDDLSNTAVSVWALSRACQLSPDHPDAENWWNAVCRGLSYLLTLEQPALSGQFSGRGLPGVQKLVYDYKLGAAFQTYLELRNAGWQDHINRAEADITGANKRYLQHIRRIQGKGTLTGGWASLYALADQIYLADYQWFERGSKWQQYVFLGWQGKLVLLDLPK